MSLKKISGKLHLYIGLTFGIFFLIGCLTGTIFVFEDEGCRLSNSSNIMAQILLQKLFATMQDKYHLRRHQGSTLRNRLNPK
ncbi:PepSY domain-containing protein [Chryseobacterium kimseyorum]|uniref:PepSY domain-containing protein n=1 Tax=Chryseobacterium kimseyorum TaxID=2984028 RepID=UPI003872B869